MFTESSNLISHTCTIFKVSKNSVCKHSHVGIVVGCQISQHNFLQSDLHLPDNKSCSKAPFSVALGSHIEVKNSTNKKPMLLIQFAFASLSILFRKCSNKCWGASSSSQWQHIPRSGFRDQGIYLFINTISNLSFMFLSLWTPIPTIARGRGKMGFRMFRWKMMPFKPHV